MTAPYSPIDAGNRPGDGPLRPGGVSVASLSRDDKDLPSSQTPAVAKQVPALTLCRDLAGGNERVKHRTTVYLPKAPGEDPENYRVRLERSVFYNVFGRTIEGLTGLVFVKDPRLSADVPVQIRGEPAVDGAATEGHWENIDLCGTHGDVFLRTLLQDALIAGHAGILVEFPRTDGVQTHADEQALIRPYWIPILKDNIVSWRTEVEAGRVVLRQLVLRECTMVPDGAFGEVEQTRYRVLWNNGEQVGFQLLEIAKDKTVIEVDAGLYANQTEIPFAEIITSGRESLLVSRPPLVDVAYLNVAHYQESSDYKTSIHKTNVPIFVTTGVDTEGAALVVSPNVALSLPTGADAKYVSHDGAALTESKASLDDLKADMGTLGLSMLAPQKRAAETVEAKRIDKQGSDSALGVTARGLEDGTERALGFHAKYLGLPSGGSIAINRSFDESVMDAATMLAYAELADKIGLPLKLVLEALQQGGRIAPSVNVVELADEMDAARDAAQDAKAQAARDSLTQAIAGTQPRAVA